MNKSISRRSWLKQTGMEFSGILLHDLFGNSAEGYNKRADVF